MEATKSPFSILLMRECSLIYVLAIGTCALLLPWDARAEGLAVFLEGTNRKNEDLQVARSEIDAAEYRVDRSISALLPRLDVSGSYTRNQYSSEMTIPGSAGSDPTTVTITPEDQWDAAATLTVPLFDGRSISRVRQARAGRDIVEAEFRYDRSNVLLAVVRAYFQTVAASQMVESARSSLATALTLEGRVRARVEEGGSTRLLLRRAEAESARARRMVTEAEASHHAALRLLQRLSGVEAEPDVWLPPSRGNVPELESLISDALAHRKDLAALRAAAVQCHLATRESAWAYVPTVSLRASERATNATGFNGEELSYQVGVTATWNLFDGLSREAQLRESQARAAQAEIRVAQLEKQIRDEVADAREEVLAAGDRVKAVEVEASAAEEAAALARDEMEIGRSTTVDVNVAARDHFSAQVSLWQARADLAIAQFALDHAVGVTLEVAT